MFAQQMQFMLPGAQLQPIVSYSHGSIGFILLPLPPLFVHGGPSSVPELRPLSVLPRIGQNLPEGCLMLPLHLLAGCVSLFL